MTPIRTIKSFQSDGRGVAIVEFALLAPLLIIFYVGMCELVQGLMAERRSNHAASAMADLITQVNSTKKTEIEGVFGAARVMIAPFASDKLEMRISSIKVDENNVAKVTWTHRSTNWSGATLAPGQTVAVPTVTGGPLLKKNETAVLAETRFTFRTPFSELYTNFIAPNKTEPGLKLSSAYYLRPRGAQEVTCSDCT